MPVSIARFSSLHFADMGDLGDVVSDVETRVARVKQADLLAQLVLALDSAGIAEHLAKTGSDAVKALVGRLRNRVNQLGAYSGRTAPDWLYAQTKADIVDTVRAAVAAGMGSEADLYAREAASVASAAAAAAVPAAPAVSSKPAKGGGSSPSASPVAAGAPSGGVRGFLKDYWLPLAIVGAGSVAAIAIALLERKRTAVAGLGERPAWSGKRHNFSDRGLIERARELFAYDPFDPELNLVVKTLKRRGYTSAEVFDLDRDEPQIARKKHGVWRQTGFGSASLRRNPTRKMHQLMTRMMDAGCLVKANGWGWHYRRGNPGSKCDRLHDQADATMIKTIR